MSAASAVVSTSVTGGTGALVLSAPGTGPVSHAAQYVDIWGTTGNAPWADYSIHEYTDATCTVLKQSEHGTCPLTFSAGIASLNRAGANAVIWSTWVFGTGYFPSANSATAPSPVSFGTAAANIRISIGPVSGGFPGITPFYNSTNAGTNLTCDLLGSASYHTESVGNGTNNVANVFFYFPFYVKRSGLYQSASIYCSNSLGAGLGRCALYDGDGTGWLGNLRADWVANGGAAWDFSSSGPKTSTMSAKIFLTAGWYGMAYVTNDANGSVFIATVNSRINPMGTIQGSHIQAAQISGTYGAFPSTAPAASTVEFTSQTNGANTVVPVILLK